jgi:ABC-type Fe3+ transport system permease subunit
MEAARNLGAGPVSILWRVVLPSLRRPLLGLWAGLLILLTAELESLVLVAPPGWVPVSLRIYTLMHYGPDGLVSALAMLQVLATGSLLTLLAIMQNRCQFYRGHKSGYHRPRRGAFERTSSGG